MCLPCFARIGESEDQSVTRYGQPDQASAEEFTQDGHRVKEESFHKGAYRIEVTFLDGKACILYFYKDAGSAINYADEKAILEANSEGVGWTPSKERDRWDSSNGKIYACLLDKTSFTISVKDSVDLIYGLRIKNKAKTDASGL